MDGLKDDHIKSDKEKYMTSIIHGISGKKDTKDLIYKTNTEVKNKLIITKGNERGRDK